MTSYLNNSTGGVFWGAEKCMGLFILESCLSFNCFKTTNAVKMKRILFFPSGSTVVVTINWFMASVVKADLERLEDSSYTTSDRVGCLLHFFISPEDV